MTGKRKNPWAGTGFGGTLSAPKVTLTPGAGCKYKGTLHGWDRYIQLVAQAYKAAPKKTPEGAKSFIALKKHIVRMFKRMQSRVVVKFVDYDPYETAEEMRRAVRDTGIMEISSGFNQSEAFGPEVNLMLRAVHDFSAHLGSNPKKKPRPFSLKGELQSYNKHLNLVGKSSKAAGALYTEIVGQVCYFFYYGDFPKQKIVTMPDFSWTKIGEVKGYKIVDKDLIRSNPKEETMFQYLRPNKALEARAKRSASLRRKLYQIQEIATRAMLGPGWEFWEARVVVGGCRFFMSVIADDVEQAFKKLEKAGSVLPGVVKVGTMSCWDKETEEVVAKFKPTYKANGDVELVEK